ncbi:hypothetical protein ACHAP7_003296 [Fusarium lateritium]
MAPADQQDKTSATSSQTKPKTSKASSKSTKPSKSKKTQRRAQSVSTNAPRQPDEIEEAETIVPVKTPPKQNKKTVEPSSSDDDTDDAESVYLSSDEETSSEEDSSDYDSDYDSEDSVEELPPRQIARRSTDSAVKSTSGSPFTITQTRSETTRWISTQNNGGMTRGTRNVNEQTTMHGQNVNGQQQRLNNRNSVSFNMSINVDMSFNGLVTGRNLRFTGGSLSYAWNRRNTQGG